MEAVPVVEVDRFVEEADALLAAAVLPGAVAGRRAGEMRGEQRTDIRNGRPTVTRTLDTDSDQVIAPKHDKTRDVPRSPRLPPALISLSGISTLRRSVGGSSANEKPGNL